MFHDIVFPDTCMQMYKLISRIPNLREESYSDVGSLKRKIAQGKGPLGDSYIILCILSAFIAVGRRHAPASRQRVRHDGP